MAPNHALPRHPLEPEVAHVRLTGAPEPISARIGRIDADHAHAKAEWQRMGEPEYLGRPDVERLQQASRLQDEPFTWRYAEGTVDLEVTLPPHGVAVVTLELRGSMP